jgi:hypothetical protein
VSVEMTRMSMLRAGAVQWMFPPRVSTPNARA